MEIDAAHAVLHTTSALNGTARRHRIWFVVDRSSVDRTTVYLYAAVVRDHDEPAWVTNLRARPDVAVELDDGHPYGAAARIDAEVDELERVRAMRLLRTKYTERLRNPLRVDPGTGILVALDLR